MPLRPLYNARADTRQGGKRDDLLKKYKIIANPVAGRGKAKSAISRTQELFARRGAVYDLEFTSGPKEAGKIARAATGEFDVVVALGGDGTVNEVVQGLINTPTPLAVIPRGSGNDFAKALKIPRDLEAAVDAVFTGTERIIDAGKINDTYFANSVGIGFDAAVTRESRSIERLKGIPLYLTAVIKALGRYKPVPMTITLDDDRVSQEVFLVTVGNGTTCGGGFVLTPHAVLNDGLLDVTIVDPMGVFTVLRHLPAVFSGTIDSSPYASLRRATRVLVESSRPVPVHVDGEVYTDHATRFDIALMPRALTVIGRF